MFKILCNFLKTPMKPLKQVGWNIVITIVIMMIIFIYFP